MDLVGGLGFALLLIVVHEYGHLGIGRLLGVPADSIRVDLGGSPPHVALRDADRWISPKEGDYAEVFQRHCGDIRSAWTYIAGGAAVESAFALTLIVALNAFGAHDVAIVLSWATAALFAAYLVGDAAVTASRGGVSGDWSAMFAVHQVATIALAVVAHGHEDRSTGRTGMTQRPLNEPSGLLSGVRRGLGVAAVPNSHLLELEDEGGDEAGRDERQDEEHHRSGESDEGLVPGRV